MRTLSPEEYARMNKLFADFIRLTSDFAVANNLNFADITRAQVWALSETARQAAGIEAGSDEHNKLTQFFVDHTMALVDHISKGAIPCLQ